MNTCAKVKNTDQHLFYSFYGCTLKRKKNKQKVETVINFSHSMITQKYTVNVAVTSVPTHVLLLGRQRPSRHRLDLETSQPWGSALLHPSQSIGVTDLPRRIGIQEEQNHGQGERPGQIQGWAIDPGNTKKGERQSCKGILCCPGSSLGAPWKAILEALWAQVKQKSQIKRLPIETRRPTQSSTRCRASTWVRLAQNQVQWESHCGWFYHRRRRQGVQDHRCFVAPSDISASRTHARPTAPQEHPGARRQLGRHASHWRLRQSHGLVSRPSSIPRASQTQNFEAGAKPRSQFSCEQLSKVQLLRGLLSLESQPVSQPRHHCRLPRSSQACDDSAFRKRGQCLFDISGGPLGTWMSPVEAALNDSLTAILLRPRGRLKEDQTAFVDLTVTECSIQATFKTPVAISQAGQTHQKWAQGWCNPSKSRTAVRNVQAEHPWICGLVAGRPKHRLCQHDDRIEFTNHEEDFDPNFPSLKIGQLNVSESFNNNSERLFFREEEILLLGYQSKKLVLWRFN